MSKSNFNRTHGARNNSRPQQAPRPPGTDSDTLFADQALQLKSTYNWSKWDELAVIVRGLRLDETTFNLWRNFRTQGNIVFIELFEDRKDGKRTGLAKVKFSPPPERPFWAVGTRANRGKYPLLSVDDSETYHVMVSLDERQARGLLVQSPIKKYVWYEPRMRMFSPALHIGVMVNRDSMMPLHSLEASGGIDPCFCIDLLKNRIVATFNVEINDPRSQGDKTYYSTSEPNKFNRIN